MKKVRAVDVIAIIIGSLCLITFGISFFVDINIYIIYGVLFVLGMSVVMIVYIHYTDKLKNKIDWQSERIKLSNSISYRVKVAGEKSFNEMPLGIVIFNSGDYHIEWANPYAKNIFQSTLIERKFENFDEKLGKLIRTSDNFNIDIYGKEYNVVRKKALIERLNPVMALKVIPGNTIEKVFSSLDNIDPEKIDLKAEFRYQEGKYLSQNVFETKSKSMGLSKVDIDLSFKILLKSCEPINYDLNKKKIILYQKIIQKYIVSIL